MSLYLLHPLKLKLPIILKTCTLRVGGGGGESVDENKSILCLSNHQYDNHKGIEPRKGGTGSFFGTCWQLRPYYSKATDPRRGSLIILEITCLFSYHPFLFSSLENLPVRF